MVFNVTNKPSQIDLVYENTTDFCNLVHIVHSKVHPNVVYIGRKK